MQTMTEEQKNLYGAFRKDWKAKLFNLIKYRLNRFDDATVDTIIEAYTYLQNFSIYKSYDYKKVKEWFRENEENFLIKLQNYLSITDNKRKIIAAIRLAYDSLDKIKTYHSVSFHTEFLDDLKSEVGLMIKTKYNNFIEPAVYDSSTQKQAFIDFLTDINVFREQRGATPYTEESFGKEAVNG